MREATWRAGLGEFSDCLVAGLVVALASLPVVTAAPALVAGCRAVDRSRRGIGGPLWTLFWADFRSVVRGGVVFGLGCLGATVLFAVDLEVAGSLPGAGLVRPVLGVLAGAAAVIAVRTCAVVAGEAAASPGNAAAGPASGPAGARRSAVPRESAPAGPAGSRAALGRSAVTPGTAPTAGPAGSRAGLRRSAVPLESAPAAGHQARRGAVAVSPVRAIPEPSWRQATLTAARETVSSPGNSALLAAAIGLSGVLVWMLPILAFVVAGPLCLAAVATGGRR